MSLLSVRREVGEFRKRYKWMALAVVLSTRVFGQLVDKNKAPNVANEGINAPLTGFPYPSQIGDGRSGTDPNASLNVTRTGKVWVLSGMLYGDDAASYERHGDVKAPTYHDLRVAKEGVSTAQLAAVFD